MIIVRLDRVLADRKMKLSDLANEINITVANLSNLKTGKAKAIRFSTLDAICKALDCQPADIMGYTNKEIEN
ncbi:XRE family transcriptional regulator [Staphylococcus xylosus]|uniref:helix-turn-helix domain-containing protein n=1 Tax=Staphylococcus xylosus TaxID=1288 RepID=UPI00049B34F5|nr:helix-turn-helix transcriptional regulator [Staphylococcus xylosus]AID02401.1 XRE family transcriptional regulator [Staphylococcus xylosus]